MTRKDYVAIAAAIDASRYTSDDYDDPDPLRSRNIGVRVTARNIADVLQADNPRFDRDRFLKACGV